MRLEAWRLIKARYASNPLDGTGARLYGGRWNSVGVAMVYASSTAALAAMEVLTHLPPNTHIPYRLISLELDDFLVISLSPNSYPKDWNRTAPASSATQKLGDRWIAEGRSAVLQVKSVHVPLGTTFLFNPAHPHFKKIKVISAQPYFLPTFNRRLAGLMRCIPGGALQSCFIVQNNINGSCL